MKEYKRDYPQFSLCGLNCGLCPRYHTDGTSRCPGCGGEDFHLKHPSCAIITCSQKHDGVEFCFQCSAYPCDRYQTPFAQDSFITYQHVIEDLEKAKSEGLSAYAEELDKKVDLLKFLLEHCNDGRRKSFYCIAVNLLSLADVLSIVSCIQDTIIPLKISLKERSALVVALFKEKATELGIILRKR